MRSTKGRSLQKTSAGQAVGQVDHERWMRAALVEAEAAAAEGEVPVGCVVVHEGRIVGRGHNRTESLKDPTAHAEIVAIGAAATALENWRLSGATVYVTIEPCLMCTGALVLARPDCVVFGARDEKFGCLGSRYDIAADNQFNHRLKVVEGVLATEAGELLKRFFRARRGRTVLGTVAERALGTVPFGEPRGQSPARKRK
ncbi:MAG: tRNA adenosine(34) deaminase TadA [candidate division WOR-3 bacterium]|nr:tRNA adenosine(34) deaminase TadA [candidate division WOR-3 bacterium]